MGLASKILAILNVLAAIAFLVFASLDYGKRQSWSRAVLEQDFLIRGLPVDENETDEGGRQKLVGFVGPKMQQQLFAGVAEKTQQTALKTRKEKLEREIPNAANPRQELETVLVPLARSESQREELRRQIRDEKRAMGDLLTGPFAEAFQEAERTDLELDQRRQAIAHVLVNTSRLPEEYQQTLQIVGLSSYVRELDNQAAALAEMMAPLETAMEDTRSAFEVQHTALLQRITEEAERIRSLEQTLASQQALLEKHRGVLAVRQQEVDDLNKRIEAAKQAVKRALDLQSGIEAELFAAQRAVTTTDDQNQKLERDIKARELGRDEGGRR